VEHRVARAGERGERHQRPIARSERDAESGAGEQRHACDQDAARPDAVDQVPGGELGEAGHREEDAHQRAEFGIADAELVLHRGKERRQRQLEEMAEAMRAGDGADHPCIVADRVRDLGHARQG
jgi:hypothetical protein